MKHFVKCWPEYYEAIDAGFKPFDVRLKDRDYKGGDTLVLQEWQPNPEGHVGAGHGFYTGRVAERVITYVLDGGQFGIAEDHCVLGLRKPWICDGSVLATSVEFGDWWKQLGALNAHKTDLAGNCKRAWGAALCYARMMQDQEKGAQG